MSKKIKLYALSTCIHCRNTKDFLKECGVQYECVDVDKLTGEERERALEEVKKFNPDLTFPTLVIEDEVIVGFRKEKIKEVLDK